MPAPRRAPLAAPARSRDRMATLQCSSANSLDDSAIRSLYRFGTRGRSEISASGLALQDLRFKTYVSSLALQVLRLKFCASSWKPPMWMLLLLPFIGLLWVPFYNFEEPALFGFPFFYWYQLAWVPIMSLLIWLVYRKRTPDEAE